VEFRNEGHLGGYVIGGDPMTWCPLTWAYLLERFHPANVLDVGCGEGHSLEWFREKGLSVQGIDGIPQVDEAIVKHDFTKGSIDLGEFDLGWCCEFVEHVEEEHVSNFMWTLVQCKVVAMTAAAPGQVGWHHVNCREAEYWISLFSEWGFDFKPLETQKARALSPGTWFERNGLIFERRG
jgi:SAM-dependent methyltransferase